MDEALFYKTICNIYTSRPVVIKGFIIPTEDELKTLITICTQCNEVEFDTTDIDCNCDGTADMKSISNITCIKNNDKQSFKYTYFNEYSLITKYNINLKFVR